MPMLDKISTSIMLCTHLPLFDHFDDEHTTTHQTHITHSICLWQFARRTTRYHRSVLVNAKTIYLEGISIGQFIHPRMNALKRDPHTHNIGIVTTHSTGQNVVFRLICNPTHVNTYYIPRGCYWTVEKAALEMQRGYLRMFEIDHFY